MVYQSCLVAGRGLVYPPLLSKREALPAKDALCGLLGVEKLLRPTAKIRNASATAPANLLILFLVLVLATVGCKSLPHKGRGQDDASVGIVETLFNGTNFAGWKIHSKAEDRSKSYWRVEEGCIIADSLTDAEHDYIWLATEREFGDFELRLKFQVFRDSPGNSGVQIRSRYDETAGWLDGPQLDIHPPAPWRSGMIYDETRGVQKWISPCVPKVTDVRPDMAPKNLGLYFSDQTPAWNVFNITAQGTHVHAVLNDVEVQDWNGAGLLDDAIHRQLNVGMRGHIALQIHKGDRLRIRFKDITLIDLDRHKQAD